MKILLISPSGKRWVEEGEPFRFLPGEVVAVNAEGQSIIESPGYNLTNFITKDGILFGNVIKKVTTAFGIKHCLKCKGRQLRYNEKGLELQQKLREMIGI